MPEGFEYVAVEIIVRQLPNPIEHLTVELNRVAQHGWKLVGPPVPHTAMNSVYAWTATFERAKEWESAA
ncbi:hypothetical protein ASF62_11120 [Leifsonia sp. Leaf325]|nr:hypothetical protein [Leifsonia sp. Leaf325]KQQ94612.1 hypothetical protein ASF62_11120 [Leifsonia sp. Leaf325]